MMKLLVLVILAAIGLHAARNRILARALPLVVGRLRSRFPQVLEIAGMQLDAGWVLEISGLRLSLERRVVVEISRARVERPWWLAVGSLPGRARLACLDAVFCFTDPDGPASAVTAGITYTRAPVDVEGFVRGTMAVRDAIFSTNEPAPGAPALAVEGPVEVDLAPPDAAGPAIRWALGPASGRWGVGSVDLKTGGVVPNEGRPFEAFDLRLATIGMDVIEPLGRFLPDDLRGRFPLRPELRATLELGLDGWPRFTHRVRVDLGSGAGHLAAEGKIDASGTLGTTRVTGELGVDQAFRVGWLPGFVVPSPERRLSVDAGASGSILLPTLAGSAFSREIEVTWPGGPRPTHRLESVGLDFSLDRDRFRYEGLAADVFGGRLTGRGETDLTDASRPYRSVIELAGARVERIETTPEGRCGLASHLRAAVSGAIELAGTSREGSLRGEGSLVLGNPEYLLLRKLEGKLSSYDLPLPSLRGPGPCRAAVSIGPDRVSFSSIQGLLDGSSFTGDAWVGFDGALGGKLVVRLSPEYLSRSPILSVPAALTGSVSVDVVLSGRIDDPHATADRAGALGRIVSSSRLASNVAGVLDGLFGPARPADEPAEDLDTVFERILAGGPDADGLMDRLADSGLTEDEIRSRLEDYRRRRGFR